MVTILSEDVFASTTAFRLTKEDYSVIHDGSTGPQFKQSTNGVHVGSYFHVPMAIMASDMDANLI